MKSQISKKLIKHFLKNKESNEAIDMWTHAQTQRIGIITKKTKHSPKKNSNRRLIN